MLNKKINLKLILTLLLVFSNATFADDKSTGNEGWAAFSQIQLGNKKFYENSNSERSKLVNGQQPPVIVLSCSDSRVPPEKIFDQGLGQIFAVRSAGHVLNSDGIASIEYAVEHLKAKVLVVMGHDSCGAVKAALTTPEGKSAGSPHLDSLLSKIRPAVGKYRSIASDDKTLEGPVKAHVTATLKDLLARSKIVREAVDNNELLVAQGIYHLASGRVDFWSVGQPIVVIDKSSERTPSSTKEKSDKPKKAEEVKKEEPKKEEVKKTEEKKKETDFLAKTSTETKKEEVKKDETKKEEY